MKIRALPDAFDHARTYMVHHPDDHVYLIAIPEFEWSIELAEDASQNDVEETLVLHLFSEMDEPQATLLASYISNWIFEDKGANE
ncbi:YueH family protein [Staphylococcus auricularis]|uniref:YueH family protein n=1 Tax=Staphylococcus auricularis TaxID=29379 RepID=UPI00242F66A0|nr:YueH family protein [Staphylococcus auricularis]